MAAWISPSSVTGGLQGVYRGFTGGLQGVYLPDGGVDLALVRFGPSQHQRLIVLGDRAALKLSGQRLVRGRGEAERQEPAGVAVQPVHRVRHLSTRRWPNRRARSAAKSAAKSLRRSGSSWGF
eukprot:8464490-Pyramimonas_sp.AAC.1